MVKPEEVRPRDTVLNSKISTSVHSSRCKTSLMQQSQSSQKLNKTTTSFCTDFAPREHKPSPYHHTTRVITDQKYNQMLQSIEQRQRDHQQSSALFRKRVQDTLPSGNIPATRSHQSGCSHKKQSRHVTMGDVLDSQQKRIGTYRR